MRIVLSMGLIVAVLTMATADANAWYCTAEARNGASGWGFNFFQVKAEQTALAECRSKSRGKVCRITSCW